MGTAQNQDSGRSQPQAPKLSLTPHRGEKKGLAVGNVAWAERRSLLCQDRGHFCSFLRGAGAGAWEAGGRVGRGVSPSQPRPWRPRPSISEVQRRHLVGDGKLRGRSMCEPGLGGNMAVIHVRPQPLRALHPTPEATLKCRPGPGTEPAGSVSSEPQRVCGSTQTHRHRHLRRGLRAMVQVEEPRGSLETQQNGMVPPPRSTL